MLMRMRGVIRDLRTHPRKIAMTGQGWNRSPHCQSSATNKFSRDEKFITRTGKQKYPALPYPPLLNCTPLALLPIRFSTEPNMR